MKKKRMRQRMTTLLVQIWRRLGIFQWYALWLAHHKFIIGVSGVILDDRQRILLLRHRYWKTGSWGLPSGYVEHQEKLEEALYREVWEETKYKIQVKALLRIVSGYKLRLEASYLGQLIGGELHLDPKEVMEARFFALDELPEGLLPSHREIIALTFSHQS